MRCSFFALDFLEADFTSCKIQAFEVRLENG
jgi:hypothetical protein